MDPNSFPTFSSSVQFGQRVCKQEREGGVVDAGFKKASRYDVIVIDVPLHDEEDIAEGASVMRRSAHIHDPDATRTCRTVDWDDHQLLILGYELLGHLRLLHLLLFMHLLLSQ